LFPDSAGNKGRFAQPTVRFPIFGINDNMLVVVWGLGVLWGGPGAARGRVGCRVGGAGGQRLDGLGCKAGFGWVAETRPAGKGPEPGHRSARDPSGQPSNHSIGESDEPGFAL